MPLSPENLPRVSFIMPTLNAEALLDNVLASITRQTYPREQMEIILADAHSTDRTREIAKKYGALVLDDDGKNMEEGKRLALRHATGEYIVFVDADNEITHPDYIELAVKALAANPQALGVESYYLPSPKMSSFCAYLTASAAHQRSDCLADERQSASSSRATAKRNAGRCRQIPLPIRSARTDLFFAAPIWNRSRPTKNSRTRMSPCS